jgi:hypothetical protein
MGIADAEFADVFPITNTAKIKNSKPPDKATLAALRRRGWTPPKKVKVKK